MRIFLWHEIRSGGWRRLVCGMGQALVSNGMKEAGGEVMDVDEQGVMRCCLLQLDHLELRLKNAAVENSLLHKQLATYADSTLPLPTSGEGSSLELLGVLRRDKELLTRKNELLNLEVNRLTDTNGALARQHKLCASRLAELESATQGSEAASHDGVMKELRELSLLRDSNALLRQREAAREEEVRSLEARLVALSTEAEPWQREKVAKERECAALAGQVRWACRVSSFSDSCRFRLFSVIK